MSPAPFTWNATTVILLPPGAPSGIRLAAADLARDAMLVFGTALPATPPGAPIRMELDRDLAPESWAIAIASSGIAIRAADELGGIYALYALSHGFLGIDPLWYWTDQQPQRRPSICIPGQTLRSEPARFRLRGLFINDEDLLGAWQTPAGMRFGDWPERHATTHEYHLRLLRYYTPVIDHGVMDAIAETVLRLGGNLLIPASFVDVMNAPEAELIVRAVRRGLYVSQHHVEPLGVSFFAFQSFHHRLGHAPAFDYHREPEAFHAAWRAYAEAWWALAGEKVVWQLGLRGKGDRAAWTDGASFSEADAAGLMDRAISRQWDIIRAIDTRPVPPSTLTCWLEVSRFMERGQLRLPTGCILVHCDQMQTPGLVMNGSFAADRQGAAGGCYLHLAVYATGPHLVQGVPRAGCSSLIDDIASRGDTGYALINAANIREHILGLETVFARLRTSGSALPYRQHLDPADAALLDRLIALQYQDGDMTFNDGRARRAAIELLAAGTSSSLPDDRRAGRLQRLAAAADALDAIAVAPLATTSRRDFLHWAIHQQATILAALYRAVVHLAAGDRNSARSALLPALELTRTQTGRWTHWYRGDTKIDLAGLVARCEERAHIG